MLRLLDQRTALPLAKITDLLFTSPQGTCWPRPLSPSAAGAPKPRAVFGSSGRSGFFGDHTGVDCATARRATSKSHATLPQVILTMPVRGASAGFLLRPHQVREPGDTRIPP